MGYFSNGSEGHSYEARWCNQCVHNADEEKGCPVWGAHLLFSYELCNNDKHPGKIILDMLIPPEGISNGQCAMFHCALKYQDNPGQTTLFDAEEAT